MLCATTIYVARLFLPTAAPTSTPVVVAQKPTIPNDLLLSASKWQDAWAREQVLRNIQELYEQLGDWDKVRYLYSQQDYSE